MFWQTLLQMLADGVAQFLYTAIQAPDDARRGGNAPGHIVLSTRTDPARGYLPADGGTHPTEDYPDLSHAQGTGGDTDFDVPDTAGRVVVLEDVANGLLAGDTGGGTGTADLPAHSHGLNDHEHGFTQDITAGMTSIYVDDTINIQIGGGPPAWSHVTFHAFSSVPAPQAVLTGGPSPDTTEETAVPDAIDLAAAQAAYVVVKAEVKT